jgi:hypothetical protein
MLLDRETVNLGGELQMPFLHYAVSAPMWEHVKLCLAYGADVNQINLTTGDWRFWVPSQQTAIEVCINGVLSGNLAGSPVHHLDQDTFTRLIPDSNIRIYKVLFSLLKKTISVRCGQIIACLISQLKPEKMASVKIEDLGPRFCSMSITVPSKDSLHYKLNDVRGIHSLDEILTYQLVRIITVVICGTCPQVVEPPQTLQPNYTINSRRSRSLRAQIEPIVDDTNSLWASYVESSQQDGEEENVQSLELLCVMFLQKHVGNKLHGLNKCGLPFALLSKVKHFRKPVIEKVLHLFGLTKQQIVEVIGE